MTTMMSDAGTPVLRRPIRERTALGLTVICAGGLMDAYSYLTRGNVFATGQTGNVVLLAIHLAQLDWLGVARYLAPIVAFVIGILASKHVLSKVHAGDHFRMQRWVIVFEAVAFVLISLVPPEVPDLPINLAISLCAAVSFENFRTFGTKSAYASVFCTGNLRSFAETLYDGLSGHNYNELGRAFRYLAIVGSFVTGVLIAAGMCHFLGSHSCWGISVLFLLAGRFVSDIERDEELGRA